MNLAVLLLSCRDVPRVTAITRDWVHQLTNHVARFVFEQSGERELLEFRVFDWCTLPLTAREWSELGFAAGGHVVPMVQQGLGVDLAQYSHFALVIDFPGVPRSGAWDPNPNTRKYCHIGAPALTPALLAHEIGHLYNARHANHDSPSGLEEYGDQFCIMGREGDKFSFPNSSFDFRPGSERQQWRYCRKCRGLFHNAGPLDRGVCPADEASHEPEPAPAGLEYWLTDDPSSDWAQRDWRACKNCNGLFFGGYEGGWCPAGKRHDPQAPNYTLRHYLHRDDSQPQWRYCSKCRGLFYNGFHPNTSVCPVKPGAHEPAGFNFTLSHSAPPPESTQGGWRFCDKCRGLFFPGFEPNLNLGTCPVNGNHRPGDYNYTLPHRVPDPVGMQGDWRFCDKCRGIFFNGDQPNASVCPVTGTHRAVGFNFQLSYGGPTTEPAQPDWRYCKNCRSLFYHVDSQPNTSVCPVGGGVHDPFGYNFTLPHDVPGGPRAQPNWRYCSKCRSLFFHVEPNTSVCPVGGGVHDPFGYNFTLSHSAPPPESTQGDWRYCEKCCGLFFDGFDPNTSQCPRPGNHYAAGYNFELPHRPRYNPSDRAATGSTELQADWRYCRKCDGLFFDGDPNKGVCPRDGGGHEAVGFEFLLLNKHWDYQADGPGMCASSLTGCGWLNLGQPNVGVDVGPPLRSRPGEAHCELKALDGAPPTGWGGPPVIAWADGLHAQRLYLEYRSPATTWDQGLMSRGAQVGLLGSIVAHLTSGAPPNVSTLKIAAFPAALQGNFFLDRVGTHVIVSGINAAQGTVTLVLRSELPEPNQGQANWRFCGQCFSMFYDGFQTKGICPAPGIPIPATGRPEHLAAGLNYVLPHDVPASGSAQDQWRYCNGCFGMFYSGHPPNANSCPAGGAHAAAGFMFVLPYDVLGPGQDEWRYCNRCQTMFFNGFAPNTGVCPLVGGHAFAGFNFVLPHK